MFSLNRLMKTGRVRHLIQRWALVSLFRKRPARRRNEILAQSCLERNPSWEKGFSVTARTSSYFPVHHNDRSSMPFISQARRFHMIRRIVFFCRKWTAVFTSPRVKIPNSTSRVNCACFTSFRVCGASISSSRWARRNKPFTVPF